MSTLIELWRRWRIFRLRRIAARNHARAESLNRSLDLYAPMVEQRHMFEYDIIRCLERCASARAELELLQEKSP